MKSIRITLDNVLKQKGITRYQLAKDTGICFQIIDKYYKDRAFRYDKDTLLKICLALDCDISEIIKLVDE